MLPHFEILVLCADSLDMMGQSESQYEPRFVSQEIMCDMPPSPSIYCTCRSEIMLDRGDAMA